MIQLIPLERISDRVVEQTIDIPVPQMQDGKTDADNQRGVLIQTFEGERGETKGNNILGKFHLNVTPRAPDDVPLVGVTFDIDAKEILNVSADDESIGRSSQIVIMNEGGRLLHAETDRMAHGGEEYRDVDEANETEIEDEYCLENCCVTAEKGEEAERGENGSGEACCAQQQEQEQEQQQQRQRDAEQQHQRDVEQQKPAVEVVQKTVEVPQVQRIDRVVDIPVDRPKTIQIFVKVDGTKTVPMEVSPKDRVHDAVEKILNTASGCDHDVYVTSDGRVLRTSEELGSCGVRVGSMVQIASMLRGGGRQKDKKSQTEKRQAANTKRLDQKCVEGAKSDKGPAIQECDKEAVIWMIEENEVYREIIECVAEGSDVEVEDKMQWYLTKAQEFSGFDKGQRETVDYGIRWAVEKRKKGRGREEEETARQEQWKKMRFGEQEPPVETQAQSTDKQDAMSGLEEVKTSSEGEMRGVRRTRPVEKGKGNGGKGEHGSKGGLRSKGTLKDVRQHEEDERVRVAPNMGAGGSPPPQATSDPGEEDAEEGKKGTRRLRWADCDDEEEKESQEEQETEREEGRKKRRIEQGKMR